MERQLPGPKPYYSTGERPDLWFEPGEVWEIRGADLTISPVHMSAAGHLHPSRGVSLRYPPLPPNTRAFVHLYLFFCGYSCCLVCFLIAQICELALFGCGLLCLSTCLVLLGREIVVPLGL